MQQDHPTLKVYLEGRNIARKAEGRRVFKIAVNLQEGDF
jgi:hypothetical protein